MDNHHDGLPAPHSSPRPGDVRYALYPSRETALQARAEDRIELNLDELPSLRGFPEQNGFFVQVKGQFQEEKSDPTAWATFRLKDVPREHGERPFGSFALGVPDVPPPPPPPTD